MQSNEIIKYHWSEEPLINRYDVQSCVNNYDWLTTLVNRLVVNSQKTK